MKRLLARCAVIIAGGIVLVGVAAPAGAAGLRSAAATPPGEAVTAPSEQVASPADPSPSLEAPVRPSPATPSPPVPVEPTTRVPAEPTEPAADEPDSGLPMTGMQVGAMVLMGSGMLAGGIAMLAVRRRRSLESLLDQY